MAAHDETLKQLGRVTVNFQRIEAMLGMVTWSMLGTDQRAGQIVTTNLAFSKLCDVCLTLMRYRRPDGPFLPRMEAIVKRASVGEQRRNTLVHSHWLLSENDENPSEAFRMKFAVNRNQGFKVSVESMTSDVVKTLADELASICVDVTEVVVELAKEGVLGISVE